MKKPLLRCDYCIIGAGPAGLAAAYELVKNGKTNVIVVDKNSVVGGLARTIKRGNHRFDVGPHRLYTKNHEVQEFWKKILGQDLGVIQRTTRIYYKGKYFSYPISLSNVISNLGITESFKILASFAVGQIMRKKNCKTFEDWVVQNFGMRLYEIFFRRYTEKIWGVSCKVIDAKWASQRIKGLNLIQVIKNKLGLSRDIKKSLVEKFYYPAYGAGQLYENIANQISTHGVTILLNHEFTGIEVLDEFNFGKIAVRKSPEIEFEIEAKHIFNSSPLTRFIERIKGPMGDKLKEVSRNLLHRDHITVNLIVTSANIFSDQWIYIHDDGVKMARVANYKNFSKEMANTSNTTPLSVEYFVTKNDSLWQLADDELVKLAFNELKKVGIIKVEELTDSFVIREADSYPAYYLGYEKYFNVLKEHLFKINNFSPIGRGGLFKYNNQDHSILSGFYAVRNLLGNSDLNLWDLNSDSEYFEEDTIARKEYRKKYRM